MNKNLLTIVICTYNRAHILPEALESLLRQTVSPEDYYLLIIDNNSTDNTQEVLIPFKERFPYMRIVMEYNQGLSHARNRALKECQTEWLAFLDDDAKAHPDWVETILQTIEKGDFDGFGGPFYAWHHYGPAPRWLPEDFGTYESPQGYGLLEENTYIPGGNSVLRCDAARSVGTFSTELGMNGDHCGYGEETQFFERMRTAGYRMGYVPKLKIDHCVLPYKYTLRWQMRSAFEYGKAAAYFPEKVKYIYILFWGHCIKSCIRIAISVFRNSPKLFLERALFKSTYYFFQDIGSLYMIFAKHTHSIRNITKKIIK